MSDEMRVIEPEDYQLIINNVKRLDQLEKTIASHKTQLKQAAQVITKFSKKQQTTKQKLSEFSSSFKKLQASYNTLVIRLKDEVFSSTHNKETSSESTKKNASTISEEIPAKVQQQFDRIQGIVEAMQVQIQELTTSKPIASEMSETPRAVTSAQPIYNFTEFEEITALLLTEPIVTCNFTLPMLFFTYTEAYAETVGEKEALKELIEQFGPIPTYYFLYALHQTLSSVKRDKLRNYVGALVQMFEQEYKETVHLKNQIFEDRLEKLRTKTTEVIEEEYSTQLIEKTTIERMVFATLAGITEELDEPIKEVLLDHITQIEQEKTVKKALREISGIGKKGAEAIYQLVLDKINVTDIDVDIDFEEEE